MTADGKDIKMCSAAANGSLPRHGIRHKRHGIGAVPYARDPRLSLVHRAALLAMRMTGGNLLS